MAIFTNSAIKTKTNYKDENDNFITTIPITRSDAVVVTDGDEPLYLDEKLRYIENQLTPGAEPNQTAFGVLNVVNDETVVPIEANSECCTVELAAGDGITLRSDTENRRIVFDAMGAVSSVNGLTGDVTIEMGNIGADGCIGGEPCVPETGDYITLTDTSNGDIVTRGIPIEGDETKYLRNDGQWAVPPIPDYDLATPTSAGLMSAEDKAKWEEMNSMQTAVSDTAPNDLVDGGIWFQTGIQ